MSVHTEKRGRALVNAVGLASLLLVVGILMWVITTSRNDQRLCTVLVTIIDRSQKSLPTNPFFKEHPEALARAQADNKQALDDLHTVC